MVGARTMIGWERGSQLATVVVAAVATVSFAVTTCQFTATQKLQRETLNLERQARAVDLFVKYNELMRDAAARPTHESSAAGRWRHNLSLAIAESIWNLMNEDRGWVATEVITGHPPREER